MNKKNGKSPPDAFRAKITKYALWTVLTWLALLVGMAFLRFGTG
jgi:hypothetical protein